MKTILVCLCILGLSATVAKASQKCGANEVYLPCGDVCPVTCENKDKPRICPRICKPLGECSCKEGYARGKNYKCIPIEECDKPEDNVCPTDPNAIATNCGSPCPKTCENKDTIGGRPCPAYCTDDKCVCKEGYVLGYDGLCIRPEECPVHNCNKNETWLPCGDICPTTCENKDKPRPCPTICKLLGECGCKEGYVRDKNNRCILGEECNEPGDNMCPTDPNAVVTPCGDPCPITCENKGIKGPRVCPMICIENGCKCKDGYVKGPDGFCILPEQCPVACSLNEVKESCTSPCSMEPTCNSYFTGEKPTCEDKPGNFMCVEACRCKPGYVRNEETGTCTKPAKCCTKPNTELVKCPNRCPGGTCQQFNFAPCRIGCMPYGCQCKRGYVKVSKTNSTCVSQKHCH